MGTALKKVGYCGKVKMGYSENIRILEVRIINLTSAQTNVLALDLKIETRKTNLKAERVILSKYKLN